MYFLKFVFSKCEVSNFSIILLIVSTHFLCTGMAFLTLHGKCVCEKIHKCYLNINNIMIVYVLFCAQVQKH